MLQAYSLEEYPYMAQLELNSTISLTTDLSNPFTKLYGVNLLITLILVTIFCLIFCAVILVLLRRKRTLKTYRMHVQLTVLLVMQVLLA